MDTFNTVDKIAAYVGGGLLLVGVVLIGLLDMLFGAGHQVTGEGQIVHDALVPIDIRSYIILAGLLIMGLYAVYRVVATSPKEPGTAGTGAATAGSQD